MDDTVVERAELRSTVRIYRKEFVFDSRHATQGEAQMIAVSKYGERLLAADIEIRNDEIRYDPFELWVRIWIMKGEFKLDEDAEAFVADLEDVEVVDRNSREEHQLVSYGKVKLPA